MPMNWPIPSIVASVYIFLSVSDSLEVKYEFGKPFSLILEQVLSCGGRQWNRFGDQIRVVLRVTGGAGTRFLVISIVLCNVTCSQSLIYR